jgi:hypothetical protein
MGSPPKPRFWAICGLYFRRVRIAAWFTVFVLLSALVYLNQIGLPDFAKAPLLDKLRQRGLNLQFSRVRLRWYLGIVADDVRFARENEPLSPQLTLREVQVLVNLRALVHRQLQVDSLVFRRGKLLWPITETNQPARELVVDKIETKLRFLPNDQWALDHFNAVFAGARIQLSGIVTNASAVSQWKFVETNQRSAASTAAWQERLRRLADALKHIRFSTPPELVVDLRGDARDLESFGLVILVGAHDADTPWGALGQGRFAGRLFPASTNGLSRAELAVEAAHAQTPWGSLTNLSLRMRLVSTLEHPNLVNCDMDMSTDTFQTEWAGGNNAAFTAHWIHSRTNAIPLSGAGQFRCATANTKWGSVDDVLLKGNLAMNRPLESAPDASLVWWTNLEPYAIDWECRVGRLRALEVQANKVACAGSWSAPELTLTNLQASFSQGRLALEGGLNVASRELLLRLNSDFDPNYISALLPESGRLWLAQFTWERAPNLQGNVALILPDWTNRQPDWKGEVLPTLVLAGNIDLPQGGIFRDQLKLTSARSHFSYSNMTWHLPDLTLTRPEGVLVAEHRANERTKDFYWHLTSSFDPLCIRPLLMEKQQQIIDLFTFTEPPVLDAEIWGRWRQDEQTGFKARVALTNFTFRQESFTGVQTSLQFTNQLLQIFNPHVQRGSQTASADGLTADFAAQLIYLTNAHSTLDPGVICRSIGPQVAKAIEPYHFLNPPVGRVYGTIPMHGEDGADLHFDLDGGPFHWWKFKIPHLLGHVHWAGQHLTLSDVRAAFYGGQAGGAARFDFLPMAGTDFQFAFGATNVQLHALMNDLSSETNHLEGSVNGAISVTKANTDNWRTVNGYGELTLRDGLLWDIPLFGIFSPVLNGIAPGLGNSRASAATCGFVITNGFVFSNDLEVRTTGMRLKYRGTVDLESHLNARVEAELLRDMWAVGPFVSAVFWPVTKMFEYKVTNTLGDPRMEPVFVVPKIVLFPFHPLRTLKNLFPEVSSAGQTNAPPAPK